MESWQRLRRWRPKERGPGRWVPEAGKEILQVLDYKPCDWSTRGCSDHVAKAEKCPQRGGFRNILNLEVESLLLEGYIGAPEGMIAVIRRHPAEERDANYMTSCTYRKREPEGPLQNIEKTQA
ncbi:hypothetical protein NDU88_006888 [Pleurodeles waltl]|uniref:Uncharacterized protein n=1 Tax=Pleurodeles waltl TaxID=8319 RepID=A0AAV7QPW8_PLEWA|nr:hypothetical protein NDU88_006888 [Pleurodeles waltl]